MPRGIPPRTSQPAPAPTRHLLVLQQRLPCGGVQPLVAQRRHLLPRLRRSAQRGGAVCSVLGRAVLHSAAVVWRMACKARDATSRACCTASAVSLRHSSRSAACLRSSSCMGGQQVAAAQASLGCVPLDQECSNLPPPSGNGRSRDLPLPSFPRAQLLPLVQPRPAPLRRLSPFGACGAAASPPPAGPAAPPPAAAARRAPPGRRPPVERQGHVGAACGCWTACVDGCWTGATTAPRELQRGGCTLLAANQGQTVAPHLLHAVALAAELRCRRRHLSGPPLLCGCRRCRSRGLRRLQACQRVGQGALQAIRPCRLLRQRVPQVASDVAKLGPRGGQLGGGRRLLALQDGLRGGLPAPVLWGWEGGGGRLVSRRGGWARGGAAAAAVAVGGGGCG